MGGLIRRGAERKRREGDEAAYWLPSRSLITQARYQRDTGRFQRRNRLLGRTMAFWPEFAIPRLDVSLMDAVLRERTVCCARGRRVRCGPRSRRWPPKRVDRSHRFRRAPYGGGRKLFLLPPQRDEGKPRQCGESKAAQ
jgi:hypothetical protein